MQPIVNRFTETYSDDISILQLNATTDGAEVFEQFGLRGHPAIVILLPDGTEVYRGLGVQEEDRLSDAIARSLSGTE